MTRLLLTGMVLCLYAGLLEAQKLQTLNEHFPISRTEDIVQDVFGFLWLGTSDGLVRYDGYEVRKYTRDPSDPASIPGNNVNAVLSDSLGNLWVGLTIEGLATFDRGSEKFRSFCLSASGDTCLSPISVTALSYGPQGQLWVGTDQGLFVVHVEADSSIVKHYTHSDAAPATLSHSMIRDLLRDSQGRMWVGTVEGINLLQTAQDSFRNYRNDPSFVTGQISDIALQPSNGRVWVCPRQTEFPVYYWDEEQQTIVPYEVFPKSENREFRITFDLYDRMWASVRAFGLYLHDIRTGEKLFFDPDKGNYHGFKTYSSNMAYSDTYGNVWIAGQLLLKWPYSRKPFQSILTDNYDVISVFADENYVWFSARKPMRWNRETLEIEEYWPPGIPVNIRPTSMRNPEKAIIYKYSELEGDMMLFTTTRSIFFWDRSDDSYVEIATRYGGPLRDYEMGLDDKLWICGNQGTPIEFNMVTREHASLGERGERGVLHPYCVVRDSTGMLWFGSSRSGLFRFDEHTWDTRHFLPDSTSTKGSLSSTHVHDMLVHSDGTLWIGTDFGLDHFDPTTGVFVNYNRNQGLINKNVTSLLEDYNGDLWLGTNDGLTRLDLEQQEFTHYSRTAGLCNIDYTARAAYRDAAGWMYFGGNNGVDFFHPDSIDINPLPPDVFIKNVRLHNEPVSLERAPEYVQELTFGYHENFIEIELVALHFTAPDVNRYAYRLEGRSRGRAQWRDLGTNRVVTLANISPGSYALHARAANADGVWSDAKLLLRLQIKPPFWQTAWFYILVVLAISLVVMAIYLNRVRRIREQEALKTSFNKKIAEIELKALQAQMNPHFLFNSLNSVKSLIGKRENKKASLYLTRFSRLIRQVLNNSRKKFVKLSDELEALSLYLELESMRFKEKFSYNIEVGDNVNVDFVEVPPLLLQPYVENAIWHGLLPKGDGDRHVDIKVERNGAFIHMMVEDNGIGRDNARMLNKHSGKDSLGMKITGDRLKFLQQLYGRDARVEIQDLHSPTGTRVKIYLPIPE